MKIAVTARGKDLDAQVDERFGRAECFIIVETESMDFEVVDNTQNLQAAQGAGVQAAGNVVNTGAECVLTGHCGPRAFGVLLQAELKVYNDVSGTVKEAVESFKKGEYKPAEAADVGGHW